MTLYYLAVKYGWANLYGIDTCDITNLWIYSCFYILCGIGLFIRISGFILFYKKLEGLDTEVGKHPVNKHMQHISLREALRHFLIIENILPNTTLCIELTAVVVTIATLYFLYVAFNLESYERNRILVAFVLIVEAIIFYSLYF